MQMPIIQTPVKRTPQKKSFKWLSLCKKTFDRQALLVLRLVWLVAWICGCLLWLTAATASVVGSVKSVCSGGSAEAGFEVEAPVVHRAG